MLSSLQKMSRLSSKDQELIRKVGEHAALVEMYDATKPHEYCQAYRLRRLPTSAPGLELAFRHAGKGFPPVARGSNDAFA